MNILADTSVLVRMANGDDAHNDTIARAVIEIHRRGDVLYITPQNVIEFRAVATRPTAANGLGLSSADAEEQTVEFEKIFKFLPDTSDVYPRWRGVVNHLGVVGKQVHDARLVAVCHVHGVTHVLTFNVGHFTRLAAAPPGLVVLDPATV